MANPPYSLPPIHLEAWRRYRGLSQRTLADLADMSRTTIANLELEPTRQVQPATLQKLAKALECTPTALYFPPLPVEV